MDKTRDELAKEAQGDYEILSKGRYLADMAKEHRTQERDLLELEVLRAEWRRRYPKASS